MLKKVYVHVVHLNFSLGAALFCGLEVALKTGSTALFGTSAGPDNIGASP